MKRGQIRLVPEVPGQARDWRNDYRIWKWCRQNSPLTPSEHLTWFLKLEKDPSLKMFGVWDGLGPVGVCGLTGIDKTNQKAEFSLYIAPDQHHQGFGRDALILLLQHGFRDLNLNRIWGETFDGNPAAKMFTKLGFHYEGLQRESYFREGKFIHSHLYSFLRGEFYVRYPEYAPGDSDVHPVICDFDSAPSKTSEREGRSHHPPELTRGTSKTTKRKRRTFNKKESFGQRRSKSAYR